MGSSIRRTDNCQGVTPVLPQAIWHLDQVKSTVAWVEKQLVPGALVADDQINVTIAIHVSTIKVRSG